MSNLRGDMTLCPYCGQEVNKRGLGAHKGSINCRTSSNRRDALRAGYARCTCATKLCLLRSFDVEVKYVYDHFRAGFVGRRAKEIPSTYVPAWALVISVKDLPAKDEKFRVLCATEAVLLGEERGDVLMALSYYLKGMVKKLNVEV